MKKSWMGSQAEKCYEVSFLKTVNQAAHFIRAASGCRPC